MLVASSFAAQFPDVARVIAAFVGARWVVNDNFGARGFFGGRACWSEMRPWHGAL